MTCQEFDTQMRNGEPPSVAELGALIIHMRTCAGCRQEIFRSAESCSPEEAAAWDALLEPIAMRAVRDPEFMAMLRNQPEGEQ